MAGLRVDHLALKKELGMKEVFCISSGAMISSGLFILPGIAFGELGPGIIIAYVLASLLALPTILSKAELSTAIPKDGGIFIFTDRAMGPMMGTLGGFSAWFSLALKSAFALYGLGIFATLLEPSIGTLEIKAIAVGFCIFFMILNILGTKLSANAQVWMVFSLIGIICLYIIAGLVHLSTAGLGNYSPFLPEGVSPVLSTSGLVFISFAGSTKVAAVAGEVRKPGRNIPYGMILSWGVVSLLYVMTIVVTVGIVPSGVLAGLETPISEGGDILFGTVGIILMSIAGILAFVSTGNAGIMAASRNPMAMGKDQLIPSIFDKLTSWGTPWFSIILTTLIMILVILFTDVKHLAGYASTLKLLLFIFANLALIFMRESNIKHYRPKYKAPLYPWIQAIGIIGYTVLILLLGWEKIVVAVGFILIGILWYYLYAHGKIKREYALLRVAERVMGEDTKECLLDEELREVLIKRDGIQSENFMEKINGAEVFDLNYLLPPAELSRKLSFTLSKKIGLSEESLIEEFSKEDRKAHLMSMPGSVILSYQVKGREIYDISIIRTRRGAMFAEDTPPVNAAFIILFSKDEKNYYLNSLMWLMKLSSFPDFEEKWRKAGSKTELKKLITDCFHNDGKI
jgi:amino acid transporter